MVFPHPIHSPSDFLPLACHECPIEKASSNWCLTTSSTKFQKKKKKHTHTHTSIEIIEKLYQKWFQRRRRLGSRRKIFVGNELGGLNFPLLANFFTTFQFYKSPLFFTFHGDIWICWKTERENRKMNIIDSGTRVAFWVNVGVPTLLS